MGDEEFTALKSVSFKIDEGEMVAIMGPSGCGKTTTMNILGLLDKPTSGGYYLSGHDTNQFTPNQQADYRNQLIGFIFQRYLLLPRLNVLQNVLLPLKYRKARSKNEVDMSVEMLERVGMGGHLEHRPNEISGGQQQRVAIARALVGKPKLILADEPTGALDTHTSEVVLQLLKDIHREEGVTVVVITHDEEVAMQCQRTIRILDGLIVEG